MTKNRIVDYIGPKKCEDGRNPPDGKEGQMQAIVLMFGVVSPEQIQKSFIDGSRGILFQILTMESGNIAKKRGLELGLDFTTDDVQHAIERASTPETVKKLFDIWSKHFHGERFNDELCAAEMQVVTLPIAEQIIDGLMAQRK